MNGKGLEDERLQYRRVTSILYPFSGLDKIDPEIVRKAGERGTKVHEICEGIILGLGEIGVDDETRPYVESFKKWWDIGWAVKEMEKRFWDDDLKITGQVDLIIHTEHGLAIVDLKTSYKPSKTWMLQGSAYAYLARKAGYDVKRLYFLHLDRKGGIPKLIEYEIDEGFFLSILRVHDYFWG